MYTTVLWLRALFGAILQQLCNAIAALVIEMQILLKLYHLIISNWKMHD